MQVQWELARPCELEKMAKEEQLCIVPIGCLERHGEHAPLGTDCLIVHKIAVEAAKREPCMVFPPMYYGTQNHEATCFQGNISLPKTLCFELWDHLCAEIARNGFTKILFLNGHGGNDSMMDYYALADIDHEADYTFYYAKYNAFSKPEDRDYAKEIEPSLDDHAGPWETELVMSAVPGCVDFSYLKSTEPIHPLRRREHLGRVRTGLDWYSMYPNQEVGTPILATQEKGDKLMECYINSLVEDIKAIKADTTMPALRKEFMERKKKIGK